ncbi:MAG: hypothetical protein Q7S53_04295 [bacterium]|nr:hypothetical protein [bacterium]
MHWIQKHILRQLATSDTLRYTDLRPDNVEGNLFMYHLNQLIADGFITKNDKNYHLSLSGKKYVSSMSLESGSVRLQPKIVVMFIAKNKDGKYLLFKWKRQPYQNLISFPFGKIHYGKPVLDLAHKELMWKSGLTGDLKYLGDVYVQTNENDEVVDHYLAHIFQVANIKGEIQSNGLQGKPFWGKIEDFQKDDLAPGFEDLVNIIENQNPPYLKEIITK